MLDGLNLRHSLPGCGRATALLVAGYAGGALARRAVVGGRDPGWRNLGGDRADRHHAAIAAGKARFTRGRVPALGSHLQRSDRHHSGDRLEDVRNGTLRRAAVGSTSLSCGCNLAGSCDPLRAEPDRDWCGLLALQAA